MFLALRDQAVLVLLGKRMRSTDDLMDQGGQGHGLRTKLELAGFDLREVEHFVYEAKEVLTRATDALQRLQETDALKEKVRTLLDEQNAALESVRAEAASGGEELTRVKQRLREVERALEGSQTELRGAQLEGEEAVDRSWLRLTRFEDNQVS